jgi:hypothetical protein
MNLSALQQPGQSVKTFQDRRQNGGDDRPDGLPERRQFRDARQYSDPNASELADAIDQYKLTHRRRFITYEELYDVIVGLGYEKTH